MSLDLHKGGKQYSEFLCIFTQGHVLVSYDKYEEYSSSPPISISWCFHMIRLWLQILGKNVTAVRIFPSYPIGVWNQYWIIIVSEPNLLSKDCCPGISRVKGLSSLLHFCSRESPSPAHMQRSGVNSTWETASTTCAPQNTKTFEKYIWN